MIALTAILAERPFWAIAIQTALISVCATLLAGWALARWQRNRKRCPACGHEFKANDSGTCPKCGEKV